MNELNVLEAPPEEEEVLPELEIPEEIKLLKAKEPYYRFVKESQGVSAKLLYDKPLNRQMWDSTVEDYIRMNRSLGWNNEKEQLFRKIYSHMSINPQMGEDRVAKEVRKRKVEEIADDYAQSIPIVREIYSASRNTTQDLASAMSRLFGDYEGAEEIIEQQELVGEAGHKVNTESPYGIGEFGEHLKGAGRSVLTTAALSPAGPVGIYAGFSGVRGNQAISEADKAGLKGGEKWGYVGRAAAIEFFFEGVLHRIGFGGMEKLFAGGGKLTKPGVIAFLKHSGLITSEEEIGEIATELTDALNQKFSGVDPNALEPERLWKLTKDTFIQTLMATNFTTGIQGITSQAALKNKEAYISNVASQYGFSDEFVRKAFDIASSEKGRFDHKAFGKEMVEAYEATPEGAEKKEKKDKFVQETINNFGVNEETVETALKNTLVKQKEGEEFSMEVFTQELEKTHVKTPEGAREWADLNSKEAIALHSDGRSTRKPFDKAGLPKMSFSERETFLNSLNEYFQEGGPHPQEDEVGVGPEAVEEVELDLDLMEEDELREVFSNDQFSSELRQKAFELYEEITATNKISEETPLENFLNTFRAGLETDGSIEVADKKYEIIQQDDGYVYRYISGRAKFTRGQGEGWTQAQAIQNAVKDLQGRERVLTAAMENAAAEEPVVPQETPPVAEEEVVPVVPEKIEEPIIPQEETGPRILTAGPIGKTKPILDWKALEHGGKQKTESHGDGWYTVTNPNGKKRVGKFEYGDLRLGIHEHSGSYVFTISDKNDEKTTFSSKGKYPTAEIALNAAIDHVMDGEYEDSKGTAFDEKGKRIETEDVVPVVPEEAEPPPQEKQEEESQTEEPQIEEEEPPNKIRDLILSDDKAITKNAQMKALAKEFEISEKDMQERVEAELVNISREIAQMKELSQQEKWEKLLSVYARQPRFSKRTTTSQINQAYSTPAPLAFAVSEMAGITPETTVYEPTAGTGALLIGANPKLSHANEINELRLSILKSQGHSTITKEDALEFSPEEQYDAVVMNPPFGKKTPDAPAVEGWNIRKLEHRIALKALEAMKDSGTAVIITGAGLKSGFVGAGDKAFMNYLMNNYNVALNVEVDGSLYRNQGAAFPVRVLVIHGRKDSTGMQKLAPDSVERLKTWDQVYDKMKEVSNEAEAWRKTVGPDTGPQVSDNTAEGEKAAGEPGPPPGPPADADGKTNEGTERAGPDTSGEELSGEHGPVDRDGESKPETEGPGDTGPPVLPGTDAGDRKPDVQLEGEGKTDIQEETVEDDTAGQQGGTGGIDVGRPSLSNTAVEGADNQSEYESESIGKSLGTLVPASMAEGTKKALKALAAKVGPIDKWLASKLGYKNTAAMHKGLASEQVDGVALAVAQIDQNQGMIIGDETGIGKGRQAAAVMKYAKLHGMTPIFLTKDPKLFSDMYEDILDIGDIANPFLMGEAKDSSIVNENGEILKKAGTTKAQKAFMDSFGEDGDLGEYDCVFLPYSQIRAIGNKQQAFLNTLASEKDVIVIMDESHEASGGKSTTGLYLRGGKQIKGKGAKRKTTTFPGLLKSKGVKGAVYLSATYAKRPDNMALYFLTALGSALGGSKSLNALRDVFARGGVAMQQVVAAALAKGGQLIRREKSFKGVKFETVERTSLPKKDMVKQIDSVTSVLQQIIDFSNQVKDAAGDLGLVGTAETESNARVGLFSSIVHNYVSQLLLAAKADTAADMAIEQHKKGVKPVITLMHTMGTFLAQHVIDNGLKEGDAIDMDYGDLLTRALDRTMRVSSKDAGGNPLPVIQLTPQQLGLIDLYESITNKIGMIDFTHLPMSPIDWIHYRLKEAGITCGELTGRPASITYSKDGGVLHIRTRIEKDKNSNVNFFNKDKFNALILNSAGSTGLSLHASVKVESKKPRNMLVIQAHHDVNVVMQTFGRILRTGMAGKPGDLASYTMLAAPLEAERRPAGVLASKMKSLNANTTADTESSQAFESTGIFNKYGDMIAHRLLESNPQLQLDLGVPVGPTINKGKEVAPPADLMRSMTGKMTILPNSRQVEIFESITSEYNELISMLKQTGEYDLEITVQKGWDAKLVDSKQLEAGTDNSSMFTSDVNIDSYDIKDTRKPPKYADVQHLWSSNFGTRDIGKIEAAVKEKIVNITKQADPNLYLGKKPTDSKKLKTWETLKKHLETQWKIIADALFEIRHLAGKTIRITMSNGDQYEGFLTDILYKKPKKGNPIRPSLFRFKFTVAAPIGTIAVNALSLASEAINFQATYKGHESFDKVKQSSRTVRQVITGNVIRGMDVVRGGQMTTFETNEGKLVTGIVMPKTWGEERIDNDPRQNIKDGKTVLEYLKKEYGNTVTTGDKFLYLKSTSIYSDKVTFSARKTRRTGGIYHANAALAKVLGQDFESYGQRMVVTVSADQAIKAIDYIINEMGMNIKKEGDIDRPNTYGFPGDAGRTEIPSSEKVTGKPVQAKEVIDLIKKQWNITIGGMVTFKPRVYAGWYDPNEKSIRMKDVRDIITAIHEAGHHFDEELGRWSKGPGLPKGVFQELVALGKELYGDKKPAGGYRSEGFAEFIREYLTDEAIQAKAPNLYEWFTSEYLLKNPKEAKKIDKLEKLITAYRLQGAYATIKAFQSPIKQDWGASRTATRFARWVDTKWRDMNLPILHAMKDAGIDVDSLKPSENPYLLSVVYSMAAGGKATHSALVETTDMHGTRTGDGLRQVLEPITILGNKAFEEWQMYAIARRALELHKRGINPGIKAKIAIEVFKQHDSAVFRDVLEGVTEWSRRNLRLLVETGVITEKNFNDIIKLNPVYVPFARQFEMDEIATKRGGGKKAIYKIKGSGREIHNVIDALVWQSEHVASVAMQAAILRSLVKLYDKAIKDRGRKGAIGNLLREVNAPVEATTFSAEQLKRKIAKIAVEKMGADPEMAAEAMLDEWKELLTVYTPGSEFKGKEHVIKVTLDGRTRYFEAMPELYNILQGLNKRNNLRGWWGKTSRAAVRLQRLGATGLNMGFGLLRNPMRDVGTFAITADHVKGGPFAALAGLAEDIVGSEMERRFHAMGVDLAGWLGQDKARTQKLINKIAATTKGQKLLATARSPVEALRTILSVTEAGPRLAAFKAAYKYGMKKYGSEREASLMAAVAGKDVTVNFTRAGEYARGLNEVLLFFNAGLQSIDKMGRTFYKHPWRTIARGAGWITFLSMANYYNNRDKEWWKELSPYDKWNYIYIDMPGLIVRIPLPFEFGFVFGALPVAAIESIRDPKVFKEAWGEFARNVTPDLIPAVLKPLWEANGNRNWRDQDIIPERLKEGRLPKDQYTNRTTSVMKYASKGVDKLSSAMGERFGVSPAVLEHIVDGYTGGLYRRVASIIEGTIDPTLMGGEPANLPGIGTLFLREGRSRVTDDFYRNMEYLKQKVGSNEASIEETGKSAAMQSLSTKLSKKWSSARDINAEPWTAKKKRDLSKPFYEEIKNDIRQFNKITNKAHEMRGKGKLLIDSTAPKAIPKKIKKAQEMLKNVSMNDLRIALRVETERLNRSTSQLSGKAKKLTNYGRRVQKIQEYFKK